MREKQIIRNSVKVIEVRSDAGKLLYSKTKEGYELKCPRSKQICLVRYEDMLSGCRQCLGEDGKARFVGIIKESRKIV
ncbi:MAG: hypothetical protein HY210_09090 [Candidatus Omnitrophica bacterium]|nr:hypothetical protein [Candidatus Omnitrophota bacterium]